MEGRTLLPFPGSIIVAIVAYLEPHSILNFELCSKDSMKHVSDAAEIVLKSKLNSIATMTRTRHARLSYLQDIMQNTSQTCSLSGKRNWGVASRLNQISHEASQRLHKGLGSGVEVRYNNQNSHFFVRPSIDTRPSPPWHPPTPIGSETRAIHPRPFEKAIPNH